MNCKFLGRSLRSIFCAGAVVIGLSAHAAAFPEKSLTMVVPQRPGGANDIVARLFAKDLSTRLGQPVVVDNRPGAGGNIGTAFVARAAPTGYTLLMTVNSTQAINPLIYKNAGFDPVRDFVPISAAGSVPNVLLVNKDVKADTLDAFIAEARAKPGQFRYGSAGNGTLPHLMAAMLGAKAGIELVHVPYKGIGPALNDVLAGQIPMVFATMPAALPHVRSGSLRAFGVTSPQRVAALPDVPAIAEKFPGYEGVLWIALYAPAGTPADVLEKLGQAFSATRQSPEMRAQLVEFGVDPLDEGPEQLNKRLAGEIVQWGNLIKQTRIEID